MIQALSSAFHIIWVHEMVERERKRSVSNAGEVSSVYPMPHDKIYSRPTPAAVYQVLDLLPCNSHLILAKAAAALLYYT